MKGVLKDYFKRVFEYQKLGMRNLWYKLRHEFFREFLTRPLEELNEYRHVFKLFGVIPLLYCIMCILLSPLLVPVAVVLFLLVIAPLQAFEFEIYH